MKRIIVFAGTTEGRKIAVRLAEAGHFVVASVATEYGASVMDEDAKVREELTDNIKTVIGRMDAHEMAKYIDEEAFEIIIDATHPFAEVVSENIRECYEILDQAGKNVSIMRLKRSEDCLLEEDRLRIFDDVNSAALALRETKGNILLTTGSKNIYDFAKYEDLKERLYVRVLPGIESLSLLLEQGIKGRRIIAMQGPFSKEMNLATIREFDIKVLVTKESGKTGGLDEKIEAARESNINCFVIKRPMERADKAYTYRELLQEFDLTDDTNSGDEKNQIEVAIAGYGMGSTCNVTCEVKSLIEAADLVFGAPRLIEKLECRKYPYYLAKDIIPIINEARISASKTLRVVILMSGDTGFYSGCKKLKMALSEVVGTRISIYPGISSVAYISAKTGISYQEAGIVSTHGIKDDIWMPAFIESTRTKDRTFFITSGPEDLHRIAELLRSYEHKLKVILGYMLSYDDEVLKEISLDELMAISDKGLYTGVILNNEPELRFRSSRIKDDEFIRDKVPMTKEEIRDVSIAKLMLHDGAVLYDIGSGTGSVSVAAARLSPDIKVYAIERKKEALELTRRNVQRFGLANIEIVDAYAPEGLDELPQPTHVFIGGSGGNLRNIVDAVRAKNPCARFVINAISIETVSEVSELLKDEKGDAEIVQLSVSRSKSVGKYHLMEAINPVYIISF